MSDKDVVRPAAKGGQALTSGRSEGATTAEIIKCDIKGYNVIRDGKFGIWVPNKQRAEEVQWLINQ